MARFRARYFIMGNTHNTFEKKHPIVLAEENHLLLLLVRDDTILSHSTLS